MSDILELNLRAEPDGRVLRERELVARMQSLDAELGELETEIADFRREHFGVSAGGGIFILGASVAEPAQIHMQARLLGQHMDRIRAERNQILRELSEL